MVTMEEELCRLPSEKDLKLVRSPTMLLNESRRVIFKNDACGWYGIRVGSTVDKYLFGSDLARLKEMNPGEEIRVSMDLSGVYVAFAKRFEDGYLLSLRLITARVWQKLLAFSVDLPSHFGRFGEQLDALRESREKNGEAERSLQKNYFKTLRFQMIMSKILSAKEGSVPVRSVCELTTPTSSLLQEGINLLAPKNYRITFHFCEQAAYGELNPDDLRYTIAEMLAVVAEIAHGNRFVVESIDAVDEYAVRFVFDPLMDDVLYRGLLSGDYSGDLLGSAYGDVFLDLFLVRMMCERSGWDFRVVNDGESGVVRMTVAIPKVEGTDLQLNCPPDSGNIVRAMLARLL